MGGCCCGGGSACQNCTSGGNTMSVAIAGVVNGGCTGCSNWNGTYVLSRIAGDAGYPNGSCPIGLPSLPANRCCWHTYGGGGGIPVWDGFACATTDVLKAIFLMLWPTGGNVVCDVYTYQSRFGVGSSFLRFRQTFPGYPRSCVWTAENIPLYQAGSAVACNWASATCAITST